MRTLTKVSVLIAWAAGAAMVAAAPHYQIFDIGVVEVGDTDSQGFGVSPAGLAVGRSFRSGGAQAFTWTPAGGIVGLPNLAGRTFAVSNDANDNGIVVGTAANTAFGSARLPVIWQNGVVSQLPLPAGETLGDANGVNVLGVAVGSVDGGSLQQAVIYQGGSAAVITQTTPDGCFFVTAFGINNSSRIVGQGIDPNNAARNVGIVYDMGSPAAFEVGALPGANGALAFAVSNAGHVVGSSMMNQGSGLPFIWSEANGMVAIPLATGTSQGSARGVNSDGWVVGQDSSAFSIPFLWDGTTTHRLADLLPPSDWDLSMNTSSSALGISDNNVIVGTGVHNGEIRAYAMIPMSVPIPTPSPSPTPTATPSPTPCGLVYRFREHFDGVTAPALPADWVSGFAPGPADCTPAGTCGLGTNWVTSTTVPHTAPNCAFHDAPGCVTDSILDTPVFVGGGVSDRLVIHHSYDLETGLDGAVVEISIDGGPFVDFVAAGGGGIGYNGTISSGSFNPIAGRSAFTGNSGGYVSTFAAMPPGQNVRLRFRLATDCSGAGSGWRIDTISVETNIGCPSPTPTPSPPVATRFEVIAPSVVGQFQGFNFTVRALDQFNNTATNYAGTIHFTSTSQGNLPPDSTLTDGMGTFSANLQTTGNHTITATDTLMPSVNGTSNTILVVDDQVTPPPLTPTPTPTVTPTPTPTPTPTSTPSPTPPTQALNVSTRLRVQTGDNVGIGGFIITGIDSKQVLLRGIGPSLVASGITDALANPTLDLRDSNGVRILANNDWREDPAQEALIEATGIPPTDDLEAAIVQTLAPGSYTVILRGMGMTSGVGLVEIYDLTQGVDSKLANLSTRAFIDTGNNIVIAGFILGGSGNDRIVARGIGPSLSAFGVPNALQDPTLELRDGNGTLLVANNDWEDDPDQAAELTAAGLAPTNSLESGIAATLAPGLYTALLAGANNGTGVGLVEVYDRGASP